MKIDYTKVFNLVKLTSSLPKYEETIFTIIDDLKEDFDIYSDKVKVKGQELKQVMHLSNFLTVLILLRPFAQFKQPLEDEFILSKEKLNNFNVGILNDYYNKVIERFLEEGNSREVNDCIATMQEQCSMISFLFNEYFGNSVSIHSIIDLSNKNERLNDIIHTDIPEDMSIPQKEKYVKDRTKECVDILKSEDNCFKDYLNCGEGINKLQLEQYMVSIGFKPDLEGNTQPIPVNTNYLLGFKTPYDYYIDATGGRKAAIVSHKQVRSSGYMMRKLALLCTNTLFAYKKNKKTGQRSIVDDCGSENYVLITVTDKFTLNILDKKYFLDGKKLRPINKNKDTDLIGQTIKVRTASTCKCKTGVCKKCYGELYKINSDIHIGILAILELTSRLTQKMLSSKHLLSTASESIDWSEDFLKYFQIDTNAIIVNPDMTDSNVSICIDSNNISEDEDMMDEFDEDMDSSEIKDGQMTLLKQNLTKFDIIIKEGRGEEKIKRIHIDLPKPLYITDFLQDAIINYKDEEETEVVIPMKSLINQNSEPLFYFIIENNELSKALNQIIALIDKKEHLGQTTITGMLNTFISLLSDSGMGVNMTHIDLIIRELIRDKENVLKRPENIGEKDFSDDEYQILKVTDAILKSPSLSVSFSFEQIKRQVLDPLTYAKEGTSYYDSLI